MERVVLRTPKTKLFSNKIKPPISGNRDEIQQFLALFQQKYNLNTPEHWNSITWKQIQSNGGSRLFSKHSIFEIKCMGCPEGKSTFNNPPQPAEYWDNQENIDKFLSKIKEKFNLNTPNDWNSITQKHIRSNGGRSLSKKYSMFEIKCMGCPEGKSTFKNPPQPAGYWDSQENIDNFLSKIKEKYNLNTPDDWNSITQKHIQSKEGGALLKKYSMFELKCMGCPEGKSTFKNPPQPPGYWDNQENIDKFLSEIKEKYNLNTPDDWNSITQKHIQSNGGGALLNKHSLFELKCMGCPEGKSTFKNPAGYWDNQENIDKFLSEIKEKYNLNTPDDWDSITTNHITSHGGWRLVKKYSLFEIKCMGCPEGKLIFNIPPQPRGYWNNQENIDNFISKIKEKYNLNTPEDWKRLSKNQIIKEGGSGLLTNKIYSKIKIKFENEEVISISKLLSGSVQKRSSQRWLFLQIKKLYPHEEIIEDYFHPTISRISGANVQFDIFMIERNIAIEYHGQHHYEDMPAGFCPTETYKYRDSEKQKLCSEHGIQLIVIPYWWDNKIESLKETLFSKIKQFEK